MKSSSSQAVAIEIVGFCSLNIAHDSWHKSSRTVDVQVAVTTSIFSKMKSTKTNGNHKVFSENERLLESANGSCKLQQCHCKERLYKVKKLTVHAGAGRVAIVGVGTVYT